MSVSIASAGSSQPIAGDVWKFDPHSDSSSCTEPRLGVGGQLKLGASSVIELPSVSDGASRGGGGRSDITFSLAKAEGDNGVLGTVIKVASAVLGGLPTVGHREGEGMTSESGRLYLLLGRFRFLRMECDNLKGTISDSSVELLSSAFSSNSVWSDWKVCRRGDE